MAVTLRSKRLEEGTMTAESSMKYAAIAALAVLLAGCVTAPGAHDHHAVSAGSRNAADGDKGMCGMHSRMMSANTPAEREAMMRDHMKDMTPEEKKKRMEGMQDKCK
jgi:hypothetical protein